ncbi:hypothetical protein Fmac_032359 [Flemingia macrophylla]|uniref:PUM-HD domain-containing protein n=1 Tax=Flemingia macrophylla TaxID=520843 RepID=A0ABD1L540_9FABA
MSSYGRGKGYYYPCFSDGESSTSSSPWSFQHRSPFSDYRDTINNNNHLNQDQNRYPIRANYETLEDAFSRLSVAPAANHVFPGEGSALIAAAAKRFHYARGASDCYPFNDVRRVQRLVRYDRNDAVPPSASQGAFLRQTEPQRLLPGLPFPHEVLRFGFQRKPLGDAVNGRAQRLLQQQQQEEEPLGLGQCCVYDLKGKILSLAKDQVGCRFLQERMRSLTSQEEVSFVFSELIGNVVELMLDPSGNYVFQKLVEICSEEQRTSIILTVTKTNFQLVNISLDAHGCEVKDWMVLFSRDRTRAVQKLLEHVTTQEQRNLIMTAICPGTVALTKDSNGLHVIEHCLKHFSNEDNKYILDIVANNCFDVATDRSGCCVMQYCVDHAQGETKEQLINEIIINASLLADDCYGNYVVQHLVSLKIPRVIERILRQLENKFFSLSCNKYGSNVVEKFFHDSGELYSTHIILELLCHPNVSMLLVDPYGNYVIKSALCVSRGPIRNTLRELVECYSPMMRNNLYGKKLLGWFDKWKLRQM